MAANPLDYFRNPARISINKRRTALAYPPPIINIEPTNICNLKCIMCPHESLKRKQGFMDMLIFEKVLAGITYKPLSIGLWNIGEPLLHPEIVTMVQRCSDKSFPSYIFTNATLLTRELSRGLIRAGLQRIVFSFEGEDPAAYEQMRPGALYGQTLANIIEFLKIKQEMHSTHPWTVIEIVRLHTQKHPQAGISASFQRLFKGLPLDSFKMCPTHNWAQRINAPFIGPCEKRKYSLCRNIYEMIAVLWDGSISPCCQDIEGEICMGNINNESILEAWNNEKYVALREKIMSDDLRGVLPCLTCNQRPPFINKGIKGALDLIRYTLRF
jgi:radical SAM protein with 4Fe4S-binding SPASM domain